MSRTVCVEGNIGCGKTTFLEHFKTFVKNKKNISVLTEPVDEWTSGYNILGLFYKNAKQWSFSLQMKILLTLICQQHGIGDKIIERSIHSSFHCFAKLLLDNGNLEPVNYLILKEWYEYIIANHLQDIDHIIYLRTDPSVAFARIQQRGRHEEETITLEYVENVHKMYETWLVDVFGKEKVVVIDANCEISENVYQQVYDLFSA